MRATIILDMDGEAFAHAWLPEIWWVLRQAAEDSQRFVNAKVRTIKLRDSSGNTCGRLTISGRRA